MHICTLPVLHLSGFSHKGWHTKMLTFILALAQTRYASHLHGPGQHPVGTIVGSTGDHYHGYLDVLAHWGKVI